MKPYLAGTVAAAAVIIAFVAGTQIEFTEDGPFEEAGEELDAAIDGAGDTASDAGAEIGEALREAGDTMDEAARQITEPAQQ